MGALTRGEDAEAFLGIPGYLGYPVGYGVDRSRDATLFTREGSCSAA